MKEYTEKLWQNRDRILLGLLLGLQALVFLIFRGDSYIQVHDNLDLFMAHFEALNKHGLWFAHHTDVPILHGVSRNLFGSEFSLYNILYMILPGIWAYLAGYALKIAMGLFSMRLLAKDVLGSKYKEYRVPVLLCSAAFGMIPVFPAYGLAFTSIPLILFLLRRLYLAKDGTLKSRLPIYLGVFCYPFVSYFSYHGFFILAWLALAVLILWIRDRRFPLRIFAALILLALGYVCFEYRLFYEMLFSDTVTIRGSMAVDDLSLGAALLAGLSEFVNPAFHNQDSHSYVILGAVLAGLIRINAGYIKRREAKQILRDPCNLIFGMLLFNCLIYGLYLYAPFPQLVAKIVPQLEGFNFGRTSFLNPCLWYLELLLLCIRLYQSDKKLLRITADVLAAAALLVVMFLPQLYNDFYYTVYNQAFRLIKQKETTYLNYNEFYSTGLFEEIKEDIDYRDEWTAVFGMHPAVADYNGFATLDGYLGMYSQEYKEQWGEVIAPALAGSPSLADYFYGWGARVCLYSASDENTYAHTRDVLFTDHRLLINTDALRRLDCRYILSRVEISNADELGLEWRGSYTHPDSPYTIWLYQL